ncbi:hypothetical protein [Bacillus subtilis]|uniref:hypothetical protein n=1 Tax=Bacillus subtilis TaxID=1423 RepID=UPI0030D414BF
MWPRYHPYFRQTDAVVSFIDITESDSGSPLRAVYAVPATTQEVKPISGCVKNAPSQRHFLPGKQLIRN